MGTEQARDVEGEGELLGMIDDPAGDLCGVLLVELFRTTGDDLGVENICLLEEDRLAGEPLLLSRMSASESTFDVVLHLGLVVLDIEVVFISSKHQIYFTSKNLFLPNSIKKIIFEGYKDGEKDYNR